MSLKTANYDNPLIAVFLRILSWEIRVAKRDLKVSDVVTEQVQTARRELGLPPNKGGAPHSFIQKLRSATVPLLSGNNKPPKPLEKIWSKDEWRLLFIPPHNLVRQLSNKPIFIEPVCSLMGNRFYFDDGVYD